MGASGELQRINPIGAARLCTPLCMAWHAKADATKVILAKAIAARLPRAQKPARSGTDARAMLLSQRCCKKPHRTHTSAEDGAAAPRVAKKLESTPQASLAKIAHKPN